ncbi:hypothetical protein L596_000587 [Steinernema carpocapsae]|uniref:Uncharacterized protein n=1 Tax=Steinernema carpocapsae TaxID=34508 RepID=A0A4U8UJ90_STECR|nr:hypothetical protein L596_000587 [Steinernema carpocapsae]
MFAFFNSCALKKVLTAIVTWSAKWELPILESNKYFSLKIVPSWNSLPELIVRFKNATAFKQKVRQWLS